MNASATKLGIVNKALIKVGAKTITSLTSTTEPNAVIMNALYAMCLTELLEDNPYSFAIQTVVPIPLNPQTWATQTNYAIGTFVQQSNLIYVCAIANLSGVFATDLSNGYWVLQAGYVPLLLPLPVMNDGVSVAYALPSDFMSLYLVSIPNAQLRIEMLKPPYITTATVCLLSDTPGLVIKYVFNNDDPTTYSTKFTEALCCKLAYEACFKISEAAQYATKLEADCSRAIASAMSSDSNNNSPDESLANEWFIARLAGSGVVSGLPNGNIGFFPDPFNPQF